MASLAKNPSPGGSLAGKPSVRSLKPGGVLKPMPQKPGLYPGGGMQRPGLQPIPQKPPAYPPVMLPGSPPRNGGIPGYNPGMLRPPGNFPGRRPGNLPGKYPGGLTKNPQLNPDLLRRMAARRLSGA